jgi:hypothetical protein
MSNEHDTHKVRSVNAETPTSHDIQRAIFELAVTSGSGFFPERGIFTLATWAKLLDVEEQTFRRWLKQFKIPHRRLNTTCLIEPQDILAALPKTVHED